MDGDVRPRDDGTLLPTSVYELDAAPEARRDKRRESHQQHDKHAGACPSGVAVRAVDALARQKSNVVFVWRRVPQDCSAGRKCSRR